MRSPRRIAWVSAVVLLAFACAPAAVRSTQSIGARPAAFPRPEIGRCHLQSPRFHTRRDIHFAGVCVSRRASHVAPGYILITTRTGSHGHHGLLMLDNSGQVVWYLARHRDVNDLKVVSYGGQRLLAWHEGGANSSGGTGTYYLMNANYRIVGKINIGKGLYTDMHELQITPEGTALLLAHPDRVISHRTGQKMRQFLIREVDPKTGATLFNWRMQDHVPLSASYHSRPHGSELWEPYHGNSVREMADGNLLMSARNTSAVYKINRKTGDIIWTLGGRQDSFDLVSRHRDWQFCHQHDASELANGDILVFDDGGSATACPNHRARAEEFALNTRTHTVRLVREFRSTVASADGHGYSAWYVGSARRLSNGDTLVSWGQIPHVSEFTPGGHVNFDLTLGTWTYRAVRESWLGLPPGKPAVVAGRAGRRLLAWASWNGATRVESWTLLAGDSRSALAPVGRPFRRTGFETRLAAHVSARYAAVQASDASGHAIGQSRVVPVR